MILGKYNQAKTITFDLVAPDGVDLIVAATFAAGDVVIMKDEGAEASTTNLPTDEGTGYSLVLTATEMSAARIRVYIIDQTATKIWLDVSLGIETYGNASAEHAFDLDTANVTLAAATHTGAVIPTVSVLTTLPAITASWLTAAGIAAEALDGKGNWNIGKTGYSLAATGLDLIVSTATGMVEIAKAIWDRLLTGATHNITNSAGKRLRQAADAIAYSGTVNAAGATSTVFILDAGASAVDNFYKDQTLQITDGALEGNASPVLSYIGATKQVTLSESLQGGAPANGVGIQILADHNHPVTQIRDSILADSIPFNGADIATILADTNELQTDWVDGGRLDLILDSAGAAGDPWATALPGAYGAGTAGKLVGDNVNAPLDVIDANVDLVLADTNELQVDAVPGLIAALNDISVAGILTTAMTESYAADGAAPTLAQALMLIQQMLGDFAIAGTTLTVKKLDGATTAATFTLDDAVLPTSLTRAT